MKLVGGDSGRVEREEFVESVIIAPSERVGRRRAVRRAGTCSRSSTAHPSGPTRWRSIDVERRARAPSLREQFDILRTTRNGRPSASGWRRTSSGARQDARLRRRDGHGRARGGPSSTPAPMHPEVVSAEPGTCPKCGMKLLATRRQRAYACPMHPEVVSDEPDRCPNVA